MLLKVRKFVPLLCYVAFVVFGAVTAHFRFWKVWHRIVPPCLYLPNLVELTRAVPVYYALSISHKQPYTRLLNTVVSMACALLFSVPDDLDGSMARHSNGTSELGNWFDHVFLDNMYNYLYVLVFWNLHNNVLLLEFGLLIFISKAGLGAYPLEGFQYLVPCFSPPLLNAIILAFVSALHEPAEKWCAICFALTLCVKKPILELDGIINNILAN